ncbi:hypothetical protein SSBR45G_71480 [Bradyrhizobium sp. SSBR45G]|uniref:hypothetical protein n=1 Tax=unclassified Bradyrhizobium TaxID=2631580 RepID=UPI0023429DDF|nr:MULTISPECIES: hypothetical protein [unclassified Bradyrhizobium]GLH82239.1 hypothetical protein SSBR45G_71480 [Bradyrhizobium sp. SSBR45G]GLH89683.1 hypothetical protein SSBR45R_71440 [Bradyrhizobium sp. SSBR45R]
MTSNGCALAVFTAGFGLLVSAAQAQTLIQAPPQPLQIVPWQQIAPAPQDADSDEPENQVAAADPMQGIEVDKLDWSQLAIDETTFLDRPEAAAAAKRKAAAEKAALDWSNQSKGSAAAGVSVKQSVSTFWDARVGADMTVTRQPTTMSELLADKAENGGNTPQSGGSAWAAVTAPGAGSIWDKTAIEARVDPGSDQSRLGTTITKAVPIDHYNLTLQNGYNVTQQGMVPIPGAAPKTSRSFDTEQSARLSIQDTGTSVTAGQTLSSSDDKWLRKIGAEQKLSDGLSVSGSVSETAQGGTSKSISAGFKRSW